MTLMQIYNSYSEDDTFSLKFVNEIFIFHTNSYKVFPSNLRIEITCKQRKYLNCSFHCQILFDALIDKESTKNMKNISHGDVASRLCVKYVEDEFYFVLDRDLLPLITTNYELCEVNVILSVFIKNPGTEK